jgi:hypothetical protein
VIVAAGCCPLSNIRIGKLSLEFIAKPAKRRSVRMLPENC